MWEIRKFEKILKDSLHNQLGEAEGEKYFGYYTSARTSLVENLLEEIKSIIPELSDHGARHVANVLDNAERLLNSQPPKYSGLELYCLGVAILFHDVGNIYGRDKHNRKITEIYNIVRGSNSIFSQERYIVTKIGEAHPEIAIAYARSHEYNVDYSNGIGEYMFNDFIYNIRQCIVK